MSSVSDTFRERLETLRVSYAGQLPGKVQAIEDACRRLVQGPWDAEVLAIVHRHAHTLAGFGATFGFAATGVAARQLELHLQALAGAQSPPADVERKRIEDLVRALRASLAEVPSQETPVPSTAGSKARPGPAENRLVYLVEPDAPLAESLVTQVGHFGYSVRCYPGLGDLFAAAAGQPPAAVIADISLLQKGASAVEGLTRLARQQAVPVMYLSRSGDLKVRLQAVRAGGSAFFTKPVDIGAVIDKLDQFASPQATEPYRILIVEDDTDLARGYDSILRKAGMVTETLTDPLAVVRPLVEFHPDLILTDVYMAGCTGLELAALIRQQEAYLGIPIVFLSAETNPDRQLAALGLGGDDFLTKPIEPEHLIAAVSHRAHRARILRSFMVRDSLTGLLNHSKTKEQLAIEVSRARRHNGPLAFAMIDLDHFKEVNDRYGHQTGDRVLKGLARLLLQRLRKIDVVGRYGGEEFAVILPGTDAAGAVRVLDEIRTSFAHIRQHAEGTEFSVTFSCGAAAFPEHAGAAALNLAADRALYQAKNAGRNRVVLAGP